MWWKILPLIPALVVATPVASAIAAPAENLEPQATASCPGHMPVFNALQSYSSASSFCSQQLGISPVTHVVSATTTDIVVRTTTVKVGTRIAIGSTSTSTSVSKVISYSTTSITTIFTTTATLITTQTVTLYSESGAKPPACAVSSPPARLKRSASSTPTQLSKYNNSQLSAGCSCMGLPTAQVTSTASKVVTSSSVVTSTVAATTTTIISTTDIVTTTSKTKATTTTTTPKTPTTITTTTIKTVTTTKTGTLSTPTAFYLKSTTSSLYVGLSMISNGLFYLDKSSTSGADTFAFNTLNELIVTTHGSQYYNYTTVGTPTDYPAYEDWFPLQATKSGTEGNRATLCCGMTATGLLTCANGELFGQCYEGAIYEGPPAAYSQDYNFQGYACSNVTFSIVAV